MMIRLLPILIMLGHVFLADANDEEYDKLNGKTIPVAKCVARLVEKGQEKKEAGYFCNGIDQPWKIDCAFELTNLKPETTFKEVWWNIMGQSNSNLAALSFCKTSKDPKAFSLVARMIRAGHFTSHSLNFCKRKCDEETVNCVINLTRAKDPNSHDISREICLEDSSTPKVSCMIEKLNTGTKLLRVAQVKCRNNGTPIEADDQKRKSQKYNEFNEKLKPYINDALRKDPPGAQAK